MSKLKTNLEKNWSSLTRALLHSIKNELDDIGDEIKNEYSEQYIHINLSDGKPRIVCSDLANELLCEEALFDFEWHDFETLLREVIEENHSKDLVVFADLLTKYAELANLKVKGI